MPGSIGSKDSKLDNKRENPVLVDGWLPEKNEHSERKKGGLGGSQCVCIRNSFLRQNVVDS